MINKINFKTIALTNLLSVALSVVTASADASKFIYTCYDIHLFTGNTNSDNTWKVPFLEASNENEIDSFDYLGTVPKERQQEVFLRDSRSLYLNWDPDYLSFFKAIQTHYGKTETEQLAAICPSDNKDLYRANSTIFSGMDPFQEKRALQQQKESITEIWRNTKPINKDTDIVYIGREGLRGYDFVKHAFGDFQTGYASTPPKGGKNKYGEDVSVSMFPGWLHQPGEIFVTVFNKKLRTLRELEIPDEDAEKLLTDIKHDSPEGTFAPALTYAMHGNLVFDKGIIERAQCDEFTNRVHQACPSESKYPKGLDFSKCYVFDVKWVDYYRYSIAKKSYVKIWTTKF